MSIPILLLGDAPNVPSGLSRILRDLAGLLHAHREELDIEVAVLGLDYDGSPWPYRVYPVADRGNWAAGDLQKVWDWHAKGRPGVLFTIWDPSRCVGTAGVEFDGARWGYFAIDAENPRGRIGGPAAQALQVYSRVLAYTDYGRGILEETFRFLGAPREIEHLPHGIHPCFKPQGPEVLSPALRAGVARWLQAQARGQLRIGAVATNQGRKDLATLFATAQALSAVLWLHTDLHFRYWAVPELAEVYDLNDERLLLTIEATDEELAYLYSICDVTIAPGLGEGFGYPIVESLAGGTPVVGSAYAGGAEFLPPQWQQTPVAFRPDGNYLLLRPVHVPFVKEVRAAMELRTRVGAETVRGYCRGAVSHLGWDRLGPHWLDWVKRGLTEAGKLSEGVQHV